MSGMSTRQTGRQEDTGKAAPGNLKKNARLSAMISEAPVRPAEDLSHHPLTGKSRGTGNLQNLLVREMSFLETDWKTRGMSDVGCCLISDL